MKKLSIILGVLLLSAVLGVLMFHPSCRIQKFDFNHTDFIAQNDLEKMVSPLRGKNVLSVVLSVYLKSRYQHPFPQVEAMHYRITFPGHLSVKIIEKKPWIAFVTNEEVFLYSKDGVLLNAGSDVMANPNQVVIIRGIPPATYEDGQALEPHFLEEMIHMIDNIQHYLPNSNLQIDFLATGHVTLLKDDVLPIKLGEMIDIDKKFKNLADFFNYYKTLEEPKTIQYIDLRLPDKVIVRYDS